MSAATLGASSGRRSPVVFSARVPAAQAVDDVERVERVAPRVLMTAFGIHLLAAVATA